MMKNEIKKIIEKAINSRYHDFESFQNRGIGISVEIPNEKIHGDYSTNVALSLSKILKKSPTEIANEIIKDIFFGALQLGIMYLCIDNQHLKQILSRPDVITAVILGNIAWGKYVHLQRKMGLYVQQIHQQKPLLPI